MKIIATTSRLVVVLMLIVAALAAVGCNVLLPAHPRSMAIEGERVDISLLTYSEMQNGYAAVYSNAFGHTPEDIHANLEKSACFGPKPSPQVIPAFVAPLVAAAVGAIVDWTTNQLAQESDRYVAQFGYQAALDEFWYRSRSCETNLWVPNYYGLSITRAVDPNSSPAFELICGISPSADGQLFQIKPLVYRSPLSKAKVLSDRTWTNWMFWKWLWSPTHEVKTVVAVDIDGTWIDASQHFQLTKLAAFTLDLGAYNLDYKTNTNTIVLAKRSGQTSGWFPGVPRSAVAAQDPHLTTAGTFLIKAIVTQTDPSNAKKYLAKASELVQEKRGQIITLVTNQIGSAKSP